MKTTITIDDKTRKRINRIKYQLDYDTIDETINKVLDIVTKIADVKREDDNGGEKQ